MRQIDRQAMALVAATLVIDQLTKQLLLSHLLQVAGNMVPVIDGFFRLVIVWNRGVSFGLLGGDRALPAWLLSGVAIAVSAERNTSSRPSASVLSLVAGCCEPWPEKCR